MRAITVGSRWDMKNYGTLEIVKYVSHKEISVRFLTTGYETVVQVSSIRSGSVRDPYYPRIAGVGFVGKGEYAPTVRGKHRKSYHVWCGLIRRCYDPKTQIKDRNYVDCTVADEWHNYQNFARWYEDNYPSDGGRYEVDKDLLFSGNKVYSPSTCVFVTSKINSFMLGGRKGSCMLGVYKHGKRFRAACSRVGHNNYLGTFDTEGESHNVWKSCKLDQLLIMKPELDRLDTRLYPSMKKAIEAQR